MNVRNIADRRSSDSGVFQRSLISDILIRICLHLCLFLVVVAWAVYFFAIAPHEEDLFAHEMMFTPLGFACLAGAFLGATIIIVGLIRQRIVLPLREFIVAIEQISQGEQAFSLPDQRSDEIGRLAVVFRRTISAIKDRDQLLQENHRVLEAKFDLATRDLRVALLESQRAQSILFGQQRILSSIATNEPIEESLCLIKSVYEEVMPYAVCALFLVDETKERLKLVKGRAPTEPFLLEMDGCLVGPEGGVCGVTAARKEFVSSLNLRDDFQDHEIVVQLEKAGIVAGWSQPIVSQLGQLYGVLGVFYTVPREPDPPEIKSSDMLADLAGIALERNQAQNDIISARDQAQHAVRAKSDFLANMSHEIRTPMNGIIGLTDLALDLQVGEEAQSYLEMIKESSQSLMQIINDVLDFSKAEADRIELDLIEFDLHAFIERTLAILSIRARQKHLIFVSKIESHVPRFVRADMMRIGQIFSNLVSNAIKFTNKSGAVLVYIDCVIGAERVVTLKCAVTDTGVGVPDDKQQIIFDVFTQADSSTTRRFGGTGLGLSICRQLVQLMGGDIWLNSRVDMGSAFHFTIVTEYVAEQAVDIAMSENENETPSFFNQPRTPELTFAQRDHGATIKRVLIADDNPVNLLLVSRILQSIGIEAIGVDDGLAALGELQKSAFDLIFMDCQMPNLDGFETSRAIRKAEAGRCEPIPIVALTAATSSAERRECTESGMTDFLAKPFKREDLVEVVGRYLKLTE